MWEALACKRCGAKWDRAEGFDGVGVELVSSVTASKTAEGNSTHLTDLHGDCGCNLKGGKAELAHGWVCSRLLLVDS